MEDAAEKSIAATAKPKSFLWDVDSVSPQTALPNSNKKKSVEISISTSYRFSDILDIPVKHINEDISLIT